MTPIRGPFGINRFRFYRNWFPYFKFFRNQALFYFLFEVFDFQGDGFIIITLCIWHRVLQMQIPFPGDKIKWRTTWRLPKKKLFSIEEPKK